MKQSLQVRVSQQLSLTPQLQQSLKILQLSAQELDQEIEQALGDNPLLEREDIDEAAAGAVYAGSVAQPVAVELPASPATEGDSAQVAQDWAEAAWSAPGQRDDDDEDRDRDSPPGRTDGPDLREHLLSQLVMTRLDRRGRALLELLIDDLNEDGFMTQGLEEILAMLPDELGITMAEIEQALTRLQALDPPGIGARTLPECLELQLLALPAHTAGRERALLTVREHLGLLAARDFARLRRVLDCTDDELRTVQALVRTLSPRPGAPWSADETRYVVPDIVVRKVRGEWVAQINPAALPRLRLSPSCSSLLAGLRGAARGGLSSRVQEARTFIKNIQQRYETIQRIAQAIVERQRHFLDHGEVGMRPLVLREIADALGCVESTVSRGTNGKYMATPRGIFELKYFFSSHVSTDTGGACSATAIRALIRQMVADEDARTPLSDSEIADTLGKQGIVVARRTIAKYRESLQIPPVNLRRSL
jgi:RNA polymerase sigma-54 factor